MNKVPQQDRKPSSHEKKQDWAIWISGAVLLLFFIWVFVFAPDKLPDYKQRLLAVLNALLAGLFCFFLMGKIGLDIESIDSPVGKVRIKATGGVALFVLVLFWWFSPFTPISVVDSLQSIYRVRVTVLDLQQIPIEDAEIRSSIGGEPKKVNGGWQFDIPAATKPADGKLTIYASKKAAFLSGQVNLTLGEEYNPAITVSLKKDASAFVQGMVIDESRRSVSGVRVSVAGYEGEAVTTLAGGNFRLPAHAAVGQQVLLHVESRDYKPTNQWHPAGDEPATIILERK